MIPILPKGMQPRTSQDLHQSVTMPPANRSEATARCRASPERCTEVAAVMAWMGNIDLSRLTRGKPLEKSFEPDSIDITEEQAARMLLKLSAPDSDYATEVTYTSQPTGSTTRSLPFPKSTPDHGSHASPVSGVHDGLANTEALGSPIRFESFPKRRIHRQGAAVNSSRSDRNIDYRHCQIMSLVMRDSMQLGRKS